MKKEESRNAKLQILTHMTEKERKYESSMRKKEEVRPPRASKKGALRPSSYKISHPAPTSS